MPPTPVYTATLELTGTGQKPCTIRVASLIELTAANPTHPRANEDTDAVKIILPNERALKRPRQPRDQCPRD